MKKQQTGKMGEELACRHLKKRGYRIIERNYRCRYGEIDIITRKDNCLIFMEVRSKTGTGYGTPAESLTGPKKQRLTASIMNYLGSHDTLNDDWRLDFIAIMLDPIAEKAVSIEIIENILA